MLSQGESPAGTAVHSQGRKTRERGVVYKFLSPVGTTQPLPGIKPLTWWNK